MPETKKAKLSSAQEVATIVTHLLLKQRIALDSSEDIPLPYSEDVKLVTHANRPVLSELNDLLTSHPHRLHVVVWASQEGAAATLAKQTLLEWWTMTFEQKEEINKDPHAPKKLAVALRALYTRIKTLPAYSLFYKLKINRRLSTEIRFQLRAENEMDVAFPADSQQANLQCSLPSAGGIWKISSSYLKSIPSSVCEATKRLTIIQDYTSPATPHRPITGTTPTTGNTMTTSTSSCGSMPNNSGSLLATHNFSSSSGFGGALNSSGGSISCSAPTGGGNSGMFPSYNPFHTDRTTTATPPLSSSPLLALSSSANPQPIVQPGSADSLGKSPLDFLQQFRPGSWGSHASAAPSEDDTFVEEDQDPLERFTTLCQQQLPLQFLPSKVARAVVTIDSSLNDAARWANGISSFQKMLAEPSD
eukprot:TRINITY_DN103938_c0_g1_i1.p1 TRINITY_DN103938_c0_g1~~TRINITY_DN103938_c0_g1_i1.p1  ORF type:complete len:418 (+),score=43.26 TRINITY_DN103938_c0_g1_i1:75-1328(+)